MQSFSIYTPTRIFFGEDRCDQFVERVLELGSHAFLVIGGGTVEKLGFVQPLAEKLKKRGMKVTMFRGIESNPESSTISQAAQVLKRVGADLVLPVGGGSVMDAAKAIAALAFSGEDSIWPFVQGNPRSSELTGALPVAAVPTTAATASEVTPYAVISNREQHGKAAIAHESLKPLVAWLNPNFTVALSPTVTRDGAADILSHVFESYLLGGLASPLADRYSEMIMTTVLETLPVLLRDPSDLEARGDLQWAATLALNDYQRAGRPETEFILHAIEHSLSAKKPELAHGRGLATLYPAYFRWLLANGRARDRFAQLGTRLFGAEGDESTRADAFVSKFEGWLQDNGLGQSLADVGFSREDYPEVADYAVKTFGDGANLNALGSMPKASIVEVFEMTERQGLAVAV